MTIWKFNFKIMMQITRIEENGKRFYIYEKDDLKLKGLSVTSFIDLFKDNSWKQGWLNRLAKNVEDAEFYSTKDLKILAQNEADKITKVATDHGTHYHETVEKYRLGKCTIDEIQSEQLRRFLNISKPVKHNDTETKPELPIFYADKQIQIGGTLDDLLNLNCNKLYDKETDFELANERRNFIIDWKFPQYPKYSESNLGYMVQLAIYRLGLKFSYGLEIDDAMIVMTPKFTSNKKTKLCDVIYLYYLDEQSLDYFSQQFFKMVDAFNSGDCSKFNWFNFSKETKSNNFLAKRVYLL